jgi:hypothetical protein
MHPQAACLSTASVACAPTIHVLCESQHDAQNHALAANVNQLQRMCPPARKQCWCHAQRRDASDARLSPEYARLSFLILTRAVLVMAARALGRFLVVGLTLGRAAATSQSSIFNPAHTLVQKDATFVPQSETTGSDPYAHVTHPAYPNHRVRVKKSRFCDESVE